MNNKLSRRLLPFYMKLPVFWTFIIVTFLGQVLWVATISKFPWIDLRWSSFGYAFGIVLGFMQGKWTSRLWEKSYLQVLRREIVFLASKRCEKFDIFYLLRAWLTSRRNYFNQIYGSVSRNTILRFRFRGWHECCIAAVGATYP